MIGTIAIHDLKISCVIGVLPHERENPQPLHINLKLQLDINQSVRTDDVAHTVDYVSIAEEVKKVATNSRCQLLERLAYLVNNALLKKWDTIQKCEIQIKKPSAIPDAQFAALTLETKRENP